MKALPKVICTVYVIRINIFHCRNVIFITSHDIPRSVFLLISGCSFCGKIATSIPISGDIVLISEKINSSEHSEFTLLKMRFSFYFWMKLFFLQEISPTTIVNLIKRIEEKMYLGIRFYVEIGFSNRFEHLNRRFLNERNRTDKSTILLSKNSKPFKSCFRSHHFW